MIKNKFFLQSFYKKYAQFNLWTLVFTFSLLAVLGVNIVSRVQAAVDDTALKNIVLAAMTAPSELVIISRNSTDLSSPLASSAISAARGHAHDVLTKIYSPNCITCKNTTDSLDKAIEGQGKGRYRAIDAGIRDIDWRQIVINDNSASVTLAATLWSRVKFKDEFGKENVVTPTTGFVEIFTLNKVDGNWVIMNQVQDDESASALPVNKQALLNQKDVTPAGESQPTGEPQITPIKKPLGQ